MFPGSFQVAMYLARLRVPPGLKRTASWHKIIVELIVSKTYYCCTFVLAAAILLLVPLLFSQNVASRSGTAMGASCVVVVVVDFVSF